jgi:hypothetical protein
VKEESLILLLFEETGPTPAGHHIDHISDLKWCDLGKGRGSSLGVGGIYLGFRCGLNVGSILDS